MIAEVLNFSSQSWWVRNFPCTSDSLLLSMAVTHNFLALLLSVLTEHINEDHANSLSLTSKAYADRPQPLGAYLRPKHKDGLFLTIPLTSPSFSTLIAMSEFANRLW